MIICSLSCHRHLRTSRVDEALSIGDGPPPGLDHARYPPGKQGLISWNPQGKYPLRCFLVTVLTGTMFFQRKNRSSGAISDAEAARLPDSSGHPTWTTNWSGKAEETNRNSQLQSHSGHLDHAFTAGAIVPGILTSRSSSSYHTSIPPLCAAQVQ